MIIDIKKYLFIGSKDDLDKFFERAQKNGFIEFIAPGGKKPIEMTPDAQNLISAIKILRKQPVKKPYLGGGDRPFANEVAHRIISLKNEVEKHYEDKRLLEAEISRVGPFGDFSMEDIEYIEDHAHRKIQFFCMKTSKSHKINFTDEVFYIATEYDLDYFMTINTEHRTYPDMIEMRIDRPVGELQSQLGFVKDALHQLEAELKGYAGYIEFLHEALFLELDDYHLLLAKKEAAYILDTHLFSIEAWVPENKTNALFGLLDSMAVHAEEISIEAADRVPTCMENKGLNRVGQDLVLIYDVPAITDKDPSAWVLYAFTLFFAMIVADAGYGLIYLGLAAYFKYKFPNLKGKTKRLYNLFVLLAASCVVWGVLTSAYFGIKLNPNSGWSQFSALHYLAEKKADYHFRVRDDVYDVWIKKYPQLGSIQGGRNILETASFMKNKRPSYEMMNEFSNNILLEFSLLVGVVHLGLSMIRYLRRNWAGIGWILFMAGGYLYFPKTLHATSILNFMGWVSKGYAYEFGLQMIFWGVGTAVVLALIQKRWRGIGEISNVLQVFGDVLSYLRLYALAMAGSIMAETSNTMGLAVHLVGGAVIILGGHGFTMMLGIMAGVIHGLRLNFLEWYHYSFVGGGRLFNPLSKLKFHS